MQQEHLEIVSLYNSGKSSKDIGALKGRSRQYIDSVLKKENVTKRKRQHYVRFDVNFFDVIDSEAKAYFLGLLFADGYNQESNGCVRLQLHKRDRPTLEAFKQAISYTGEIRKAPKNQAVISLCSGWFSRRLAGRGCHQAKSFTLKGPYGVPDHLIHHFVRGYFDGDGCICLRGSCPKMTIVSSADFNEWINVTVSRLADVSRKNLELHPNGVTTRYNVTGNLQLQKIFQWMYREASIFMDRKYNTWRKFCTL